MLLLREVERGTGLIAGLAECFRDHRDPRLIEHTVEELLGQRIYGLCLGYEDLNDHDQLRTDPMLAVAVNKADPLGETRRQAGDRGKALAGKCTLNRLELTEAEVDEQYESASICENLWFKSEHYQDTVIQRITSSNRRRNGSRPDSAELAGGVDQSGGVLDLFEDRHDRAGETFHQRRTPLPPPLSTTVSFSMARLSLTTRLTFSAISGKS